MTKGVRFFLITLILVVVLTVTTSASFQGTITQDHVRVTGDFYDILWDLNNGGEISEIQLFDGETWYEVTVEKSVPGLTIKESDNKTWQANKYSKVVVKLEEEKDDFFSFIITSTLAGDDGQDSGWVLEQKYSVYSQGVIFSDMELTLAKGERVVTDVELGIIMRDDFEKYKWRYFKRPNTLKDLAKDVTDVVHCWGSENFGGVSGDPPAYLDQSITRIMNGTPDPFIGIDFGISETRYYTNHLEFFVEEWKAVGTKNREQTGNEFVPMSYKWYLLRNGSSRIKGPYTYTNRWGMVLGASKQTGKLVGQRVYHWVGRWAGTKLDYPPDEVIHAAAEYGATVFILHSSWGARTVGKPIPYNPKRLREVIDLCHSYGMRVMLYSRPHYNGVASGWFDDYLKRDWDGIYIDWGTPLYILHDDLRFPALDYFKLTQLLRETVGPDGLLVSHDGMPMTALGNALFDAYLAGEQQHYIIPRGPMIFGEPEPTLAEAIDRSIYETGQGYALPQMWVDDGDNPRYGTPQAVPYYAGLGLYPHIVLDTAGSPAHPSNRSFILPLWQIWRSMPLERSTLYNANTIQAVDVDNPHFLVSLYSVSPNEILLVVSNTDKTSSNQGSLTIDTQLLGMAGEYDLFMLRGKDYMSFTATNIGKVSNGKISTGPLSPLEIVGYALVKPPYSPEFTTYLEKMENKVWFEPTF